MTSSPVPNPLSLFHRVSSFGFILNKKFFGWKKRFFLTLGNFIAVKNGCANWKYPLTSFLKANRDNLIIYAISLCLKPINIIKKQECQAKKIKYCYQPWALPLFIQFSSYNDLRDQPSRFFGQCFFYQLNGLIPLLQFLIIFLRLEPGIPGYRLSGEIEDKGTGSGYLFHPLFQLYGEFKGQSTG